MSLMAIGLQSQLEHLRASIVAYGSYPYNSRRPYIMMVVRTEYGSKTYKWFWHNQDASLQGLLHHYFACVLLLHMGHAAQTHELWPDAPEKCESAACGNSIADSTVEDGDAIDLYAAAMQAAEQRYSKT